MMLSEDFLSFIHKLKILVIIGRKARALQRGFGMAMDNGHLRVNPNIVIVSQSVENLRNLRAYAYSLRKRIKKQTKKHKQTNNQKKIICSCRL